MDKKNFTTSLPELNIDDLKEQKSVRTNFKFSKKACEALDWLSNNFKITLKELITSLCNENNLKQIAEKTKNKNPVSSDSSIRKTYVISKKAFRILTNTSKEYNIPRDELFENIILDFKSLLDEILKERQERYEKALDPILQLSLDATEILSKLCGILDDDDPILEEFNLIEVRLAFLCDEIENKL